MRLGLVFDLRRPRGSKSWPQVYGDALEFAEEADRLGLDILAGEHHRWDDGYIPQPLTFLAAVAGRTANARLGTSVLLAPLYHPVALAEQTAVLDCISNGRVELGLGTGHRVPEFTAFGVDMERRLQLLEDRVLSLRAMWAAGGVTPTPAQDTIPLWAGLRGPRGSYLAGRLGLGMLYLPSTRWDDYLRGIRDNGNAKPRLGGPIYAMLADDPERAFAALAPRIEEHWHGYDRHAVEGTGAPVAPPLDANAYRRIGPFSGSVPGDPTRSTIGFGVFTPAEAASTIRDVAAGRTVDWIYFPAALGGCFDDLAYRHLELVATELPAALATTLAAA